VKTTLKVIAKKEQTIPKNLHVSGFGGDDTSPVVTFAQGEEYIARIISDDTLIATGEDNEEYRIGGNGDGLPYWMDYDFRENFEMVDHPITCIETEIWEPNPEKPGYMREVRKKTYGEVYKEVCQFLKERGIWDNLDYFHLSCNCSDKNYEQRPFPVWRWIACYAVVGSSEGHYIHVDIIKSDGSRELLFLGKTFLGMDYALYVSNMLTKVFWDEFKKCEKAPD